jgi:4-amino-4-deoxy-L-arabinose transferase-like glycosyltransferase
MMMAGYGLFGVSEWAARLGPACAGLLTIFGVFRIGIRVEEARDGREELTDSLCAAARRSRRLWG